MPAFLLPILSKIIPWLAAISGLITAFLYIKRQGAKEERAILKEKQAEAVAAHKEKVITAIEKDKAIDKTVGEKIDAIKPKPIEPSEGDDLKPGDIFKF